MKNHSRPISLLLAAALLCALAAPVLAADPAFPDVPGTWAESSIARWAEAGVFHGDAAGNFRPTDPLTRAELAQVLVNLLALDDPAPAGTFDDVAEGAWYENAVLCCAQAGILQGNGAGGADPLKTVTRQEALVMVARALKIDPAETADLSAFADAGDVADWAGPTLAALVEKGILTGVETAPGRRSLQPLTCIDRASLAALLDRAVPAGTETGPAEEPAPAETPAPSATPEPTKAPATVGTGGGGGGGGGGHVYRPVVTFVCNNDKDAQVSQPFGKGQSLWYEDPGRRTGYTFTGWYYDEDRTDLVSAADMFLVEGEDARELTESITLYAGWLETWSVSLSDPRTQSYLTLDEDGQLQTIPWDDVDGAEVTRYATAEGWLTHTEGYPGYETDGAEVSFDLTDYLPESGAVSYYNIWYYTNLLPTGYDREENPAGYLDFWPEVENGVETGTWYASGCLDPGGVLTLDDLDAISARHVVTLEVDWYPTLDLSALTGEETADLVGEDFTIAPTDDPDVFAATGTVLRGEEGCFLPWKLRAFAPEEEGAFTVVQVLWNEETEKWEPADAETRAWTAADYVSIDGADYLTDLCPWEPETESLSFAVSWDGGKTPDRLVRVATVITIDCAGLTVEAPSEPPAETPSEA